MCHITTSTKGQTLHWGEIEGKITVTREHTNSAIFFITAAGLELNPFTKVRVSCLSIESFLSLSVSTRITLGLRPSASKAKRSSKDGIVSKSSLNLLSYKS